MNGKEEQKPTPTAALFSERPMACESCGRTVMLRSVTTQDPKSPEMIQMPDDAAVGFITGDTAPEMIVTCSTLCTQRMLWK